MKVIINNNIIIHHNEFMDSMLVVFLQNDFYNIITFISLWLNWNRVPAGRKSKLKSQVGP